MTRPGVCSHLVVADRPSLPNMKTIDDRLGAAASMRASVGETGVVPSADRASLRALLTLLRDVGVREEEDRLMPPLEFLSRFVRRRPVTAFLLWFFTVGQMVAFVPVVAAAHGAEVATEPFTIAGTLVGLLLPALVLSRVPSAGTTRLLDARTFQAASVSTRTQGRAKAYASRSTLLWRRLVSMYYGSPSVAGNPRIEGTMAFERALRRHQRLARRHRSVGDRSTRELPQLDTAVPLWQSTRGIPRERVIAVSEVVGTVGGGDKNFDVDFLPTSDRARGRFTSIFAGLYSGDAVPRVDVCSWNGGYYVVDGHHRVAAALALGQEFLDANVIEVQPVPVPRPAGDFLER